MIFQNTAYQGGHPAYQTDKEKVKYANDEQRFKHAGKKSDLTEHEALRRCNAFRGNVTQSLEFCTEGFWKYLKIILEDVEKVPLSSTTPRSITRTAVEHRLIDEEEAGSLMKMIEARNNTSHLYQEEIADEFAKYAPEALAFMKTVLGRLQENIPS